MRDGRQRKKKPPSRALNQNEVSVSVYDNIIAAHVSAVAWQNDAYIFSDSLADSDQPRSRTGNTIHCRHLTIIRG